MSVKVVTRETIEKNLPFILKWSKNPRDNGGAINPGWKQQTEIDRFLELVENTPSILNDARFIQMESIEHDISYLRVKARLQSMKKLTGDNKGAPLQKDYTTDLDETVPEFSRSKLEAEPFSIFTYTSKYSSTINRKLPTTPSSKLFIFISESFFFSPTYLNKIHAF